ncbi:hypothetical protein HMPREF2955_07810 [Prevotella sp. HMSC073D09]|jgi:hypothetical protein|uniref:hypothetical protein n=1 Tax=Prevotella sp. HMSC073D09 TaxID=1739459 RepID=UPI0008A5600F|nr:hypothetical protein [Prevotella sp. HMSC073D09]OFQ22486.1 hypothetical protein HMPREF2955_07810 [Prevotella sp. HMSC073D09]
MNSNFSIFQRWTFDYLNGDEVDGMCAIIIFNTYRLLQQNGISVKNLAWFDPDTIRRLSTIDETECNDELTSLHFKLFKVFSGSLITLINNDDVVQRCNLIQSEFDGKKVSEVRKKFFTLFDSLNNYIDLLMGCLLEAYRNYDLLTGNALFRSIVSMGTAGNDAMTSAYSFLCMQQNPEGYFGFYMKHHFDVSELRVVLGISFDCIAAILTYNNSKNK